MTPTTRRRIKLLLSLLAICALLTLGLTEIMLRVQQWLGPIVDLDLKPDDKAIGANLAYSDVLNHVAEPGGDWDADGIYTADAPNAPNCAPRLLFMGDSFIQGLLGKDDKVPHQVRAFFFQQLHRDVCVFNAGHVSYAPSLYIIQAKQLIPRLHPDIILLDIDETDLYDDYYRYRDLSVRDPDGSLVAVRATPTFYQYHQAMLATNDQFFYTARLIDQLYVKNIWYPRTVKEYNVGREHDLFFASRIPEGEARQKYAPQIAYFQSTLDELTRTVLSQLGGRTAGVIYLHHPHLEHLKSDGPVFNDIVSESIAEAANRYHVRYYDATDDLRKIAGEKPQDYYVPGDMHFSTLGYRVYGELVAKYLDAALASQ